METDIRLMIGETNSKLTCFVKEREKNITISDFFLSNICLL